MNGVAASGGSKYSIIVSSDGTAHSTGFIESMDYYRGHLGIPLEDLRDGQNTFQEIERVFDENRGGVISPPKFRAVFAGVDNTRKGKGEIHTIFLDGKGNAWATGANSKGQLCLGTTLDQVIPQRINLKDIVDVAVGGEHTLLLTESGKVYGCGSNRLGQLGLTDLVSKVDEPRELSLLLSRAASVSAGRDHSIVMAKDGEYVMGSNEFGQLCVDTEGDSVYIPRAIDLEEGTAKSFEATRYSSYIVYVDGSLGACGRNNFGQLGDGTNDDAFLTKVSMPEGGKGNDVVKLLGVGPSANSVLFATKNGLVWGMGLNNRGQLGVGDVDDRNLPTLVKMQVDVNVLVLSAAEDHSLALKEGGADVMPTDFPTNLPTNLPTGDVIPTQVPTQATPTPTPSPTLSETSIEPPQVGFPLYFWG